MTYLQFVSEIENNPSLKTYSSKNLARKLDIEIEEVIEFREWYKAKTPIGTPSSTIQPGSFIHKEILDSIPSIEELETTNYKVDPRLPENLPGFSVSSFCHNKVWYKKEEGKDVVNTIDFNSIKPKPYTLSTYQEKEKTCMQIIFPTDSHISRLELSGRTIDEKCQEVIDKTIEAVELAKKLYSIDTMVFITGSDMFNSTGKNPFTVKGTLQENSVQYDKAFEKIVNMNVTIIDYLFNNCKTLQVKSVLGNHDEVECYMLGKYLQAYYRNTPIEFDVEKKFRKYIDYGNTGICIHHGDIPKFDNLIAAMASERPDIYCKKYTELAVGDKHHQKVTQLGKTIVRQYPSLAKNDTWSDSCGFSGEGFISEIYDKEKGHLLTIDLKS